MSIKSLFQDIADAIKDMDESITTITPSEMPNAIRNLSPITHNFQITVTGGYNGGATITIKYDNSVVFTATGSSPYNLLYTPSSGSFLDARNNTVNVVITPPPNSNSALVIALNGAITYTTGNIMPAGSNTSYGYNYDSGVINI